MVSRSARKAAVAGTFYASGDTALRAQIEWCFKHTIGPRSLPAVAADQRPRKILGLISPHAGYAYSGPVAAHGFYELARDGKPDLVVILGPNHRGWGAPVAIGSNQRWQTPLGEISLDVEVGRQIVEAIPQAQLDDYAHAMEHSIEVQLPFLQFLYGKAFSIVPIALFSQDLHTDLHTSSALGKAIASAVAGRNALIIASTDFTHYEGRHEAAEKDSIALDRILRLASEELFEVVHHHGITMCGPGPVAATIAACRQMGATGAELLCYATSGEMGGDYGQVVGYASVKIA